MKDAIKTYFEEAIIDDEALKNAYDEKKLDDCIKYINDQARKYLKGKNGAIADEIVYKWARDFMYGDIAKTEEEAPAEETKETQTESVQEVAEDIPADEEPTEESSVTEESVVKEDFTTGIPETLTQEQIEPEETNIDTRCCQNCGYESDHICIMSGAALGDLLSPACKEYIRRAMDSDIQELKSKGKLVIESVEEEKPAEEWKENLQKKQAEKKAKKAKKVDEYDGPTLFDFDDLY